MHPLPFVLLSLFIIPAPGQDESAEVVDLEEVVVTADGESPLSPLAELSMQPVTIVPEERLRMNAQATLGETLGWEPGVSSGYFGPGASRPVIRGFEGVRVRTLRDDLSTFDLSDISPDHGVALEPFLLESVEIHRGPASLLYGNSAIGGAVNARSRVLARERPPGPVTGGWEARLETQGNAAGNAGYLTLGDGPLALRLTASARTADDISIPGRARSEDYENLEDPRVYVPALGITVPVPNPVGILPNSAHESATFSAGLSWLPEDGSSFLGASYSRFDSRYGVPYFYPGDPTDLFGYYDLDIIQDRFDIESRMDFDGGFLSMIQGRFGYASYGHDEIFTGRGKDRGRDFIDTALHKDAFEGRIDLHHQAFDGDLTGVIGVTAGIEELTAARTVFPPPDLQRVYSEFDSNVAGLYFLENYEKGDWSGQLGYRLESSRLVDNSLRSRGIVQEEDHTSHSISGALGWHREQILSLDELTITGTVSMVERLPTATERYAFWNNAGIGRFIVGGDLDGTPLETEESLGFDLGIVAARAPFTLTLNAYHYNFDNFIFLNEAPELTGGFGRAVQYVERAATFTGFEAEADWKINENWTLSLMSDYVRARNSTDNEPIPRMPPFRVGTRLEWTKDPFTAGVEVRYAAAQDRVTGVPRPELPSDAYTLINADFTWRMPVKTHAATLFVRASNLLNQEARVSTSFRKDVAPLSGRGLALGMEFEF